MYLYMYMYDSARISLRTAGIHTPRHELTVQKERIHIHTYVYTYIHTYIHTHVALHTMSVAPFIQRSFNSPFYAFYALYALYVWLFYFPQSGALTHVSQYLSLFSKIIFIIHRQASRVTDGVHKVHLYICVPVCVYVCFWGDERCRRCL